MKNINTYTTNTPLTKIGNTKIFSIGSFTQHRFKIFIALAVLGAIALCVKISKFISDKKAAEAAAAIQAAKDEAAAIAAAIKKAEDDKKKAEEAEAKRKQDAIDKKELEKICSDENWNPGDIVRIPAEDYKSLIKIDEKHGYSNLKKYCKPGFQGNMFLHTLTSYKACETYAKATFINKINSSESIEYSNVLYLDSEEAKFIKDKSKGILLPELKNTFTIDASVYESIMEKESKALYKEKADITILPSEEVISFKEKTKNNNCYTIVGKTRLNIYIAHEIGALKNIIKT